MQRGGFARRTRARPRTRRGRSPTGRAVGFWHIGHTVCCGCVLLLPFGFLLSGNAGRCVDALVDAGGGTGRLRTASRSFFSSLRTVRTAHTPAAAAASRQAVSTSAKALSRKNFLNCSIVRYSNPFCVRNRFFGGSLERWSGVYSSFIRKDTKRPRMTGALPVALFFLCSAVREIHHRDFRHRLFHSLQNMLYLFYCIR